MSKQITLGGGCFWCIEAVMEDIKGVLSAVSGYAGGATKNPSYEQVCTGKTGHAEVVQVTYNPAEVSLHDLLTIFFTLHDPTTLNRQGADVGTQYRSIILYDSEEDRESIEAVMGEIEASGIWEDALVTEVVKLETFYPAEEYHQHYFATHTSAAYCQIIIAPKVAKLRAQYREKLKVS